MASYPGYGPDMSSYAAAAPAPVGAPAGDPYAGAYGAPVQAYAPVPVPGHPYGGYGGQDEVRTVFITGFPADVKERELNNLLRFLPGYTASQMHWKNGQAQGFALFESPGAAKNAIRSIFNLMFDDTSVLRIEMARKDMYLKDDPSLKRGRYGDYNSYSGGAAPGPYGGASVPVSNTRDNPPCNTLFVGNLGDQVNEQELRNLFASQPGFRQMKIARNAKSTTAFVEFEDIPTAMAVHQSQQGAVLTSSERGGIRIQYSKNPFGRKRDYNGNYINDDAAGAGAAGVERS